MVLERAADQLDAVGDQRRGQRVALEAGERLAVEGEVQRRRAVDETARCEAMGLGRSLGDLAKAACAPLIACRHFSRKDGEVPSAATWQCETAGDSSPLDGEVAAVRGSAGTNLRSARASRRLDRFDLVRQRAAADLQPGPAAAAMVPVLLHVAGEIVAQIDIVEDRIFRAPVRPPDAAARRRRDK